MKKLIFCFDGTCNDPKVSGDFFSDSSISNILKLHASFIRYCKKKAKKEDAICVDDISILPIINGKMHEQQRSGIAAKTLAPRLVRVNVGDRPSNEAPLIHKSVCERFMKVAGYRPYALRDWPFRVVNAVGKVRHGIKGLREV